MAFSKPQAQKKSAEKTVAYQINSKQQSDYEAFKQHVVSWHRDGKELIQFLQVREAISDYVYDTINWQQEGVPLDSFRRFKDSIGSHLIGVERQDQALDKSICVFRDTEETYQLLLCFGKWYYLGKRTWRFPDAASAVFFATSWLENNKSRFIEAANNIVPGYHMPLYIKAAIIQQIYTRLINGTADENIDNILLPDTKKNTNLSFVNGHSKSWYSLHQFIYSQNILSETYIASVRFFNLIQGNRVNSDTFVLNFPLLNEVLSEIKKSRYSLVGDELNTLGKRVKDKREIFEFAQKTTKKIHDVAKSEIELAKQTVTEITAFFDGFDLDDDIEASDIRTLLDEVIIFYKKCMETGVNVRIPDNLEKRVQEAQSSSRHIAEAIEILKTDYSEESDLAILQSFTNNPIGTVQHLIDFLRMVNKDADDARESLELEKKKLAENGSWIDNTDPRFSEYATQIQEFMAELEGVI